MLKSNFNFVLRCFIFCIALLTSATDFIYGQADTLQSRTDSTSVDTALLNKTKILIEKSDNLFGIKKGEDGYDNKFVGNVQVRSDDIVMTCDSAYLNARENKIRAYGNVDIMKGGSSSAKADYVEYVGNTAQAFMKGNVQIFDNGSNLITDNLTYNLKSKIGVYRNGGQLVSDGTTVSSDYGKYNGRSKQSYFKGNVFITGEDADIESKELTYNTETKNIVFLDQSTIYGKDAVITTRQGRYNQKTGLANFSRRTSVENSEQIIHANKIKYNEKTGSGSARGKVQIIDLEKNTILYCDAANYNKETGYGIARGHVKYVDTVENLELVGGKVEYNEFNDFLVATENPLLTTITENDSILIAADTMIALRAVDIIKLGARTIVNKKSTYKLLHQKQDEVFDDKKIIVCNKRVQIYGDSLQAVCDSMAYLQTDSTFQLFKKPVVWNADQQAEGDTIYLYMANNKVERTELRSNSYIFNDTKYPKMYNQIKGRDIDAFFKENEIQRAVVMGNAESVYYATDDSEKFVGLNRAEGARIKMLFENKQVQRIVFYNKPKGAFYPMEKIEEKDRFLDGFSWKEKLRPKSREQLRKRTKPKK